VLKLRRGKAGGRYQESVRSDIIAVEAPDEIDAAFSKSAQPCPAPTADVDNAARMNQIAHERRYGSRRFERTTRPIVEKVVIVNIPIPIEKHGEASASARFSNTRSFGKVSLDSVSKDLLLFAEHC
jgi:hypothetical protein